MMINLRNKSSGVQSGSKSLLARFCAYFAAAVIHHPATKTKAHRGNFYCSIVIAIAILAMLLGQIKLANATSISGRVEAAIVLTELSKDTLLSWQNKGVGLIRGEKNSLQWQQGFVAIEHPFNKDWKANVVLNTYADGDEHLGFTQAYLQYKPLSPNYIKFKSRFGMFYPAMSVENTAQGWLSPYTYTQSAINSWIGEELRTIGGEVSWFANGRKRRSPWSWEVNLGLYKGNDPLGSLLTWRGFAMHDRQSLHHDRVQFAPLPSVINVIDFDSPTWVEPFTEIDGNWGAYIGAHISYLRKSNLRYYFYDNRANPDAINAQRLYAWHTKFHSVAYQHQINQNWRVLAQVMDGSTLMGYRSVYADFVAWYAAVSYFNKQHRITFRFDYHDVNESDKKPQDPNDSDGTGYTLAWRYQATKSVEWGAEYNQHNTDVASRALLDVDTQQKQSQIRLVLSFVF